jgi:glutamyl-tRNA synthetase
LRTALYNFLYARRHGGKFILRIEDTDQSRAVAGAVENLIATLRWCGLEYDEGPEKGGEFGPYVQSERLALYRKHAEELIASGHGYYCFCTAERLDEVRKRLQAQKLPPMYDRHCRTLTPEDVQKKLAEGVPHVVRLKIPLSEEIVFHDIIRGAVKVAAHVLDDQVLMKSDGFPTYHLANVVDDHLMQITHVIRGEEWLPSTPKHIILYKAFGWEMPQFAHLPLLLNPDKSKLSKRQGDVAVEDYRGKGFLPEAMINFVALLGWNPTGEREVYTLDELVNQFELDRVNKAGAVFDIQKLKWMNAQYIRSGDERVVAAQLRKLLAEKGIDADIDYVAKVVHAMKERVDTMNDFVEFSDYFFAPPKTFEEAYKQKHWVNGTAENVKTLAEKFKALEPFDVPSVEQCVREFAETLGAKPATLIHPLRLALTGKSVGPGLFELIDVLGKKETISRLEWYLENSKT